MLWNCFQNFHIQRILSLLIYVFSLSNFQYFLSLILLNLEAEKEPKQTTEHFFTFYCKVHESAHNESLLNELLINIHFCDLFVCSVWHLIKHSKWIDFFRLF